MIIRGERTGTLLRTVLAHQSAALRDNDLMEIEFTNSLDKTGRNDTNDSAGSVISALRIALPRWCHIHRLYKFMWSIRSGYNSRRPAQRSSGAFKAKEPLRTRPGSKLGRLKSVLEGRDQDYIEYGQQILNSSFGCSISYSKIGLPGYRLQQKSSAIKSFSSNEFYTTRCISRQTLHGIHLDNLLM